MERPYGAKKKMKNQSNQDRVDHDPRPYDPADFDSFEDYKRIVDMEWEKSARRKKQKIEHDRLVKEATDKWRDYCKDNPFDYLLACFRLLEFRDVPWRWRVKLIGVYRLIERLSKARDREVKKN